MEVHQAELVSVRDQLRGMALLGVVRGFTRPDLPLGERVGEPAQFLLLLREGEGNARCGSRRALFDCDHPVLSPRLIDWSVKR